MDGFYEWIKFFSKDKDVLKKVFAHKLNRKWYEKYNPNVEIGEDGKLRRKSKNMDRKGDTSAR